MRPGPDVPRPGGDRGFWLEEALRADPGAPCPSLRGRFRADVCIVGGGFAGLWTAIELIEREPSLRIALLEADICGGGASGRNGGFSPRPGTTCRRSWGCSDATRASGTPSPWPMR